MTEPVIYSAGIQQKDSLVKRRCYQPAIFAYLFYFWEELVSV